MMEAYSTDCERDEPDYEGCLLVLSYGLKELAALRSQNENYRHALQRLADMKPPDGKPYCGAPDWWVIAQDALEGKA
jgi:hypothetical protein